MLLSSICIQNFRSIVDSEQVRIERFQSFIGENNAGKSNILRAINIFLSSGTGGVTEIDFFDCSKPIIITCEFSDLTQDERKKFRRYLLKDSLQLEKQIRIEPDERTGNKKAKAEYHGYISSPIDWWLNTDQVIEKVGARPDWKSISEEFGLIQYIHSEDGKVNKQSYENAIEKFIEEREQIEFLTPKLGETQVLGFPQVLADNLPKLYLLPAITDYSDEIDRRTTSTVFRRLMIELANRIVQTDPNYQDAVSLMEKIQCMFNPSIESIPGGICRLKTLDEIEVLLQEKISVLNPDVRSVQVNVEIEEPKDFFARGVSLKVNDGVLTDVTEKGNGLQRSVIFGLLETLIETTRQKQTGDGQFGVKSKPIILAIEEPELYIHPQLQRLIYRTLQKFSVTDQVIFSSHSPIFIDLNKYDCIGVVRKEAASVGTKVYQCGKDVRLAKEGKEKYQFYNAFKLEQNQMFFAKKILLVEGVQDHVALVSVGRKNGWFEYPEEIGYFIVITEGKQAIPKYQKLLNAFHMNYSVLIELDGKPKEDSINKALFDELKGNKFSILPNKLEDLVMHEGHFGSTYSAIEYFENPDNITVELEEVAKGLFGFS